MRLCNPFKIMYLVSLSQDQLHSASQTLTHTRTTGEPAKKHTDSRAPHLEILGQWAQGQTQESAFLTSSEGISMAPAWAPL